MSFDYPHHPLNFLGLYKDEAAYDSASFAILPVPYEQTTTFRKGASGGPWAIIFASREVELFDEETKSEPCRAGITTLAELEISALGPEDMVGNIYRVGKNLVEDGKIVCMLGGEHSISTGLIRAYSEKYADLSVLQLDAHADLRDDYQGSRFSHACTMKRIREIVPTTVGLGIRNISKGENELIEAEKIPIFSILQMERETAWKEKIIKTLSNNVYLTIDCDFFDPSMMPAVGTPEPGGGAWYPTLAFLKELAERKNIVGFDLTELAPLPVNNISEFTAAKLIYKIIGYISR